MDSLLQLVQNVIIDNNFMQLITALRQLLYLLCTIMLALIESKRIKPKGTVHADASKNLKVVQSCDTGEDFPFQQFQRGPTTGANKSNFVLHVPLGSGRRTVSTSNNALSTRLG